jgi:hypothetical protein
LRPSCISSPRANLQMCSATSGLPAPARNTIHA